MTTNKLSTKVALLAAGVWLSITAFVGSQPAAAEGVGYDSHYYGEPYGTYGTVKRWGAPRYHYGFGRDIGHADAQFGPGAFGDDDGDRRR